jgi:hypothetical protein
MLLLLAAPRQRHSDPTAEGKARSYMSIGFASVIVGKTLSFQYVAPALEGMMVLGLGSTRWLPTCFYFAASRRTRLRLPAALVRPVDSFAFQTLLFRHTTG